ncbi:MAG TPA: hypothetical protein ENI88_10165 [Desulfobulbus sp.]|nr:hypothetical protein [Desulfobulbus sp.]
MVEVTEVCLNDYEGIMALFGRHGIPARKYVEWKFFWQENPVLKNTGYACPRGWVLKDSGKVVGYLGNIPLEYFFRGKKIIAAAAHNWVVDKAYRQNSVLLINNYFRQENADFLINTTGGNPITQKIFLAYKAKKIPAHSYDISLFSILDYPAFLKSVAIKKEAVFCQKLAILAAPLSLLMRWGVEIRNIARYHNDTGGKVQRCTDIGRQFDEFWHTLLQQENRLLCVRDRKSLQWRYTYALHEGRIWIYTVQNNQQMIAYAIFLRDDKPEMNLKRIKLVDIQTLEKEPSAVIFKLLASAEKRCRREGIHMLEAVGFQPDKRQILAKWLPHKRKTPVWPFYKTGDPALGSKLEDSTAWDPCLFDGDGSL